MAKNLIKFLNKETVNLQAAGLYKSEFSMSVQRHQTVMTQDQRELLNLCSNNYLSLARQKPIRDAAKKAIDEYGLGIPEARLVCGTMEIHKEAESWLSTFMSCDDSILFGTRYDANVSLFEALVDEDDLIICDSLCHPSIKDGVRLSSAEYVFYQNNNMTDLEDKLKRSKNARFRLIVTDGVFNFDGTIARLDELCRLAEIYDALVVVDDSHGIGVLGDEGRGTHEYRSVVERVDLITGSLDHMIGASVGGFVAGRASLVAWLRQKMKSYLFANATTPALAAVISQSLISFLENSEVLDKLRTNAAIFRSGLIDKGFDLVDSDHPIVTIKIGDAVPAQKMVNQLFEEGVLVMGYCYPLVPMGEAVIRTQISADHSQVGLKRAIESFDKVKALLAA